MNFGRYRHGCTTFTNSVGEKVRMGNSRPPCAYIFIIICTSQVNLVCGGQLGTDGTCEYNIDGTNPWIYISTMSLPKALTYLRGVTLDNRIFMTGGV